jgi:hypothetical protein
MLGRYNRKEEKGKISVEQIRKGISYKLRNENK